MSNAQLNELFRNQILILTSTAASRGMTIDAISLGLKAGSFAFSSLELHQNLDYLISKGFLDRAAAEVAAGLERYSLTAAGREYLEGNGLL